MASVVVCAETESLRQAGRFAAKSLGSVELKSFAKLRGSAPTSPVLVYLTSPDYGHLRSFLRRLNPAGPDVVIYYANRVAAKEAAQLGKLVGETRPANTSVVFEARAAVRQMRHSSKAAGNGQDAEATIARTRRLREAFGLTQTELARAIGVSLRTVQYWEKTGVASRPRQLRDLEELWAVLKRAMKSPDVPEWLRSGNDAFAGRMPIELVEDGRARDIIAEFRRLQTGEPV